MSDQKDVVDLVTRLRWSAASTEVHELTEPYGALLDEAANEIDRLTRALEAKGYTITRGSHGVRHRQEPFESK